MPNRESKEDIVYKVVIDVLGHHLRETDGPNYKVCYICNSLFQIYKRQYIPLAMKFYGSMTDDEINSVIDTLKLITTNDICKIITNNY